MKRLFTAVCVAMLLCSCASTKDISYFQNLDGDNVSSAMLGSANVIRKGDMLSILVSSRRPDLAMAYNLMVPRNQLPTNTTSSSVVSTTQADLAGYTVDADGKIEFPVLGRIQVAGLTRQQLSSDLKGRLADVVPDAVVTVAFTNFNISVLGEVNKPGVFTLQGDRITVLEALALAGDLTVYGKRQKVFVIREQEGERSVATLDLRDRHLFDSPYFYLQQNDVVYVEPGVAKARSVSSFNTYFPIITSLASFATSLTMIIYYLGFGR